MSYLYVIWGMHSHEFDMLVYNWTSFSSMFIYTYVCTCFKCCFLRYGNIQMSIPYLIYLDSYGEIPNFDSTKTWQQQTWHLQCNIFGKWSKQGASVPPPCSCTPKLSPLQVAIRREECLKSTTAAHGFHHGPWSPWSSQACENPWAFAMYLWLVFVGAPLLITCPCWSWWCFGYFWIMESWLPRGATIITLHPFHVRDVWQKCMWSAGRIKQHSIRWISQVWIHMSRLERKLLFLIM